ncbi:MAG: hypothetical protein HYX20_00205 [Candidatus Yanofskybacteria bacterium]|nr:hypothetical protein [Candidatus Yanofskybacteria bacterium]
MLTLLRYDYKQKNDWTCGPAVARILLHYYDTKMDIRKIVKELRATPRRGTGNVNLLRLLGKNGIKFRVKEHAAAKDLKKYLKNHWVVVAYWIPTHKESHYSIIKKITSKRIYFHDTWFGTNHSYALKYFVKNWWDEEAVRWLLAVKK